MDRCVQDNRAWSAIDILTFFPALLACFSVIFHLFPIVSVETKRCLQQAVFYGMQFEWRRKGGGRGGGKLGKYCQRQKCQGQRVGRKGAAKRAVLSREQSVSQQSGFYIYIYYRVQ